MYPRGMYGNSNTGTPSSSSGSSRSRSQVSSSSPMRFSSSSVAPATSASNASINQDKYDRFEQWLRDNGAQFELLELCEYDSMDAAASNMTLPQHPLSNSGSEVHHHHYYNEEKKEASSTTRAASSSNNNMDTADTTTSSELRGVYAKTYLPANTVCMSIPRRCLITVEMGQATPIGQLILQSDLDLDAPKHIFLMVYLLWDRKVNGMRSFFWPYYEILPQTLRNMPIFWSQEELDELQGSHLLHQIADRNQAIAEDYYSICQVAPELHRLCTLDEFKWARMCVCSRNFGLVVDGHRTSALVPHADMLNHYRPRQTKWTFDESAQAFTITTLQGIMGGSQVYDSYGQKCNHRFLLNYGFAVEDNRELDGFCPNEVPLEVFVDPEDALFAEKLELWTRGDPAGSQPEYQNAASAAAAANSMGSNVMPVVKRVRVCVSNNENTRLLFSLLRTLACNQVELEALMAPFRTTLGRQNNQHPFDTQHQTGNGLGGDLMQNQGAGRSLFGMSELPSHLMQQYRGGLQLHAANNPVFAPLSTSGITPISYHRSCRDIRHPISIENERAAMRLLLDVVHRHLSQYPTSLAQDMLDLEEQDPRRTRYPPYSNERHAKIQVRGEKQVLHHFAQWARVSLDVLDVIDEELKEERGSVEVQLTQHGHVRTEERPSFESVIRHMEDEVEAGNQHHTIMRYCADVLGSLRREEFKSIRRSRVQQFHSPSSSRPDP